LWLQLHTLPVLVVMSLLELKLDHYFKQHLCPYEKNPFVQIRNITKEQMTKWTTNMLTSFLRVHFTTTVTPHYFLCAQHDRLLDRSIINGAGFNSEAMSPSLACWEVIVVTPPLSASDKITALSLLGPDTVASSCLKLHVANWNTNNTHFRHRNMLGVLYMMRSVGNASKPCCNACYISHLSLGHFKTGARVWSAHISVRFCHTVEWNKTTAWVKHLLSSQ
jgi:hypothetical protein